MLQEFIELCQNKLGRCDDYTNFNGKATNDGLKLWDGYNSVTIPWDEMPPEMKELSFQVCDDDQFINFDEIWHF